MKYADLRRENAELREALEGLLDLMKETEPNGFPEGTWAGRQIEAAVAALAKARGREATK